VHGWNTDPYLGQGEFYLEYGDIDYEVTLPAGYIVAGTGVLQNPEQVLTPVVRARLAAAVGSDTTMAIVTPEELASGAARPKRDGMLTWRFRAEQVRDAAWAASPDFQWDASGWDGVLAQAYYRSSARELWQDAAKMSRYSIQEYSTRWFRYPYPQISAIEGPVSGMEYPMVAMEAHSDDAPDLYNVITHEIGHMWFPMIVGSDEKRFAWMDEGLTQFDQSQSMDDFFKGFDDEARNRKNYLEAASSGTEVELMHHGDRFPNYGAYGIAAYYKPATVMVALRGVLGHDLFHKAFAEYGRRWQYKHPTPYDFFDTFDDVSGRDLSWFWRTWFFETWRLDQAIDSVATVGDSVEIGIENRGRAPMPVPLVITRADGRADSLTVPVDVWLGGAKRTTVRVAREPTVKSIEIDPGREFPDVDRDNQRWPR